MQGHCQVPLLQHMLHAAHQARPEKVVYLVKQQRGVLAGAPGVLVVLALLCLCSGELSECVWGWWCGGVWVGREERGNAL